MFLFLRSNLLLWCHKWCYIFTYGI